MACKIHLLFAALLRLDEPRDIHEEHAGHQSVNNEYEPPGGDSHNAEYSPNEDEQDEHIRIMSAYYTEDIWEKPAVRNNEGEQEMEDNDEYYTVPDDGVCVLFLNTHAVCLEIPSDYHQGEQPYTEDVPVDDYEEEEYDGVPRVSFTPPPYTVFHFRCSECTATSVHGRPGIPSLHCVP